MPSILSSRPITRSPRTERIASSPSRRLRGECMSKRKAHVQELVEIAHLFTGKLSATETQRTAEFTARTGIQVFSGRILMIGSSGSDHHVTFSPTGGGVSTGS